MADPLSRGNDGVTRWFDALTAAAFLVIAVLGLAIGADQATVWGAIVAALVIVRTQR